MKKILAILLSLLLLCGLTTPAFASEEEPSVSASGKEEILALSESIAGRIQFFFSGLRTLLTELTDGAPAEAFQIFYSEQTMNRILLQHNLDDLFRLLLGLPEPWIRYW